VRRPLDQLTAILIDVAARSRCEVRAETGNWQRGGGVNCAKERKIHLFSNGNSSNAKEKALMMNGMKESLRPIASTWNTHVSPYVYTCIASRRTWGLRD
jgi:hypothetical protein